MLGDWGTAHVQLGKEVGLNSEDKFFGGTPGYAGPRCFMKYNKDIFSFCRLALELFIEGPSQKLLKQAPLTFEFSISIHTGV